MIHAVIQVLINDAAVRSAVGQNKAKNTYKVYPIYADEKEEPPFVVGSIVANNPNYCKDGTASKMDEVTFRLVTYSREYAKMDQIDNAMRFAIDGYKGVSEGIDLRIRMVNQSDSQVEGKDLMGRITDYIAQIKRTA
jgi:hypothetical protein